MLPTQTRKYVLIALAATPDILEGLLQGYASDDPVWDVRPDGKRLSLREITAHLADWEPIVLDRVTKMRSQSQEELKHFDVEQRVIECGYAQSDPQANLHLFRAGRSALIAFLDSLQDGEWEHAGYRERIGPMTLEVQAVHALGHDGYHLQQAAQWLTAGRSIHHVDIAGGL